MNYFEAMRFPEIARDYPIGDEFLARFRGTGRDALRALQERRFARVLDFAWRVPFYRRLWAGHGIEPGDIKGLDDLAKLPTYGKAELMESVEAHPPLGDFHGLDTYAPEARPPLIMQTTSGTTGRPQPLLYGPYSREVQNLLLARAYLLQGMRRDDVVHSVYGFGTVNGGHYIRETVLHWIGAQLICGGTGAETRSAQQVALMRDFRATVLVGFGDFLRRLAEVARENGIIPGEDIRLRMVCGHLGQDGREPIAAAWGGCAVYDWYGVGDTGLIAAESQDQDGLHLMEDAQIIELVDPDTGRPVPVGAPGDIICTCLFKDDIFPIIRFNTHDVTEELAGASPAGLPFRRIAGFRGRSDNMVKLRGINVFPSAIGAVLETACPGFNGEFVCEMLRGGGREEMTVAVEVAGEPGEVLRIDCERALRARLGVELRVRLAAPGSLAPLTGVETRQKAVRLIEKRES